MVAIRPGPDCPVFVGFPGDVDCRRSLSEQRFSFFLYRTGKMGNHSLSSSEKRKRSTGRALGGAFLL